MFCPKCGKEYLDDAKFCSSCGCSLDTTVSSRSTEKSFQEKVLTIKSKEKSLAVAGLVNILVAGAGYFYVGKYIWGIIFLIGTVLSFIYAPEMYLALWIFSILGSIYAAYRFNKDLITKMLESKHN